MAIFDSIGKPNIEKLEARQDLLGLIKALAHKDRDVKNAATEALVRIGAPAVETVLAILPDKELRSTSFDILGRIGDQRATESLLVYLNEKPTVKVYGSHFTRKEAARALGKIADPRAAADLVRALDDEHFEVIDEAYIALRDMGLPAGDYLLPELKNEKPVLRLLAAELLGKIKDDRAL
ncbi:MAG: HEAT repeat domain-containing protein [Anaerolineaceae bacterium]